MSIWSQLEQDSATERQLLNRAMCLLYRMQPKADRVELMDIESLEAEVMAFKKNDHRGGRSTVAMDLSRVKIMEFI